MKTKFEHSAGGIVFYKNKVLVITTTNLKNEVVNTFPKGHIEKGETEQQAAEREVEEETGLKARVIKKIKDIKYWFVFNNEKIQKKVSWYLMAPVYEDLVDKLTPDKEEEKIQKVEWINLDKIEKILSYDSDKEIIKLLKERFIN
jgi:8-oxo-dGTP pyrophosphatase MutT (NUDIX family)